MSEYDNLVEALSKIEGLTDEQKQAISNPAKAMSVENGTRGQDLIKVKADLEKSNKQNLDYKDFTSELAKLGIQAKDAKEFAAKAGIISTHEDEKAELKSILLESQNETKELKANLHKFKQEQTLAPAVDKAVENFTDAEGKPIELKPDFIKEAKDLAFKGIKEDDDEVIVADRINKALVQALANQTAFMERNGFTEVNKGIHTVQEKTPAGSVKGSGLSDAVIAAQKEMEAGKGSVDSGANAIAIMEAQKNK